MRTFVSSLVELIGVYTERNTQRRAKAILLGLMVVLAVTAAPAAAEQISLQYNTFGGNTATTEGALTPDMGTAVVNGNSAVLTSNNAEVGAVWMDSHPNTQANFVSLFFDIKVLSQAVSGYGQNFGGAQTLGGVRIVQNGIFAESFQLMPTGATTGTFAFRDASSAGVQTLGTYDTDTLYHVQLDADYTNAVANAYINGSLAYSGYPLRAGTGPGGTTSEIFTYLNGATGESIHNSFQIGQTTAVPTPSGVGMGVVILALLALARRIRRPAAIAIPQVA